MKRFLAAALAASALIPLAFANTNAGSKLYVSSTAVGDDNLAKADYEALTWIEIKSVGQLGETGSSTNILNYDTWDTDVTQKGKGVTDAGNPTVECANRPNDPGQNALEAYALTNLNYAFKVVKNNPSVAGGTPEIVYHRGMVTGPTHPNGGNEDFDLNVYTLALQQRELKVKPGAGGVAPTMTVSPAITGTAQVGQQLTVSNGTFTGDATITYERQWFAGGVAISGATQNTLTLTSAQLGKKITARISATNASGSAVGFAPETAAVIA